MIQQWLMEEGDLGVVSKKFQLSMNPPLGDWSIEVEVNVSINIANSQRDLFLLLDVYKIVLVLLKPVINRAHEMTKSFPHVRYYAKIICKPHNILSSIWFCREGYKNPHTYFILRSVF